MQEHYVPKLREVMKRLDASFFFYDLDHLKQHLSSMAKIIHPDIKLWYAVKANPMSAILKVLRNLGFGIDIASRGELLQTLNAGIAPDAVLATGPAKSKEYLEHVLINGVRTIVLESVNQAIWLNEVAGVHGLTPDVLLRVQLDWPEGESVLGGNQVTPFGIAKEDWAHLPIKKLTHLNPRGFHVFQWGNILTLDRLQEIWSYSLSEIKELSHRMNIPCEILDLGGGLGIPYAGQNSSIKFSDVHALLLDLKTRHGLEKIWLELGRYSVGECGYYFTKVVDVKSVRSKKLAIVEGGINHLARPALTSQSFPCDAFNKSDALRVETTVHGPLCTALDRLGTYQLPSDLAPGDWLMFGNTGAYGFTESMPYFLCHALAGEVTYYDGNMMIPRPPKNSFEWLI